MGNLLHAIGSKTSSFRPIDLIFRPGRTVRGVRDQVQQGLDRTHDDRPDREQRRLTADEKAQLAFVTKFRELMRLKNVLTTSAGFKDADD